MWKLFIDKCNFTFSFNFKNLTGIPRIYDFLFDRADGKTTFNTDINSET